VGFCVAVFCIYNLSPLYRVFTTIFLKQAMFVWDFVLQFMAHVHLYTTFNVLYL
jgi:hypothetical protein